jgi:ABC-type lipoprotein export system ATPase subunit
LTVDGRNGERVGNVVNCQGKTLAAFHPFEKSKCLSVEPTGNLDPETGMGVMEIMKDQHDSGKTVVIITHDPNIARFAKRIVRIVEGKIANDR